MNAQRFPRDRYDPVQFELAFAAAEFILNRGKVHAILSIGDDEIEVHFPSLTSLPLSPELRLTAERACSRINALDNLIQAVCENEAKWSRSDESNYEVRIQYFDVYANRIEICYWGEGVNSEWHVRFHWNAALNDWKNANF